MRQRKKLNKPRRCSMEHLSVGKRSRLMLPGQGELEHQGEVAVEVPEVVDVEDLEETEEVTEEDMATGEEDMEEKEVDADMVAVEAEIGKEVMEEVQTATIDAEEDSVEVVDMVVVVMDVEVVVAADMKEAEEVVKDPSTARVSRLLPIREPSHCVLWLAG